MLIQSSDFTPSEPINPQPATRDLFQDDRSRIVITTALPNQSAETVCHIHASKQITVLDGYAEVELPDTRIKLYEGMSVAIPNGTIHKIVNLGKIPLQYVEIRTGPYVLDDDLLGNTYINPAISSSV